MRIKSALVGILALFAVGSASAQQFPTVPDHTLIGRIGAVGQAGPSQAIPWATVLSKGILDQIGTAQGTIPCRGVSVWGPLVPGAAGLPLVSQGTAVCPGYGVLGVAGGGTGSGTPAGARTNLNVDGYTTHNDSNYSILATDRTVGTSAALTAPRTWTLPAANAVNPGQTLDVADYFGGVTGTNTLTIQRAGSDTISGATSVVINGAFGRFQFRSDGVSKWSSSASSSASGSQIIDLTKAPYAACTGSDDTAQIRLWMAAAATGGSTPGIAYVPPGTTCLINIIVNIPSNLTIWAYGATFKMLAAGNAATTFCACDATGGTALGPTNVTVYGLTVDGNTANRTGPFAFGNFYAYAANDIHWIDTRSINCSADCYSVNGNTTLGLSHRVYLDRIFAQGAAGTRNLITFDGVGGVYVHQCWLAGTGSAAVSPDVGIDIEPDALANASSDITIDTCNINGKLGGAICVNCANIAGGAVLTSQAMNIMASSNGATDFKQFTNTPATKAGFRFINAHGVFGGSLPAVDALP